MNSFIIGIARTGSANDFVLNSETRYISFCGSKPEVTFSIECGQNNFFNTINELRYADPDPDSTAEAISFLEALTTKFFTDLKYLSIEDNNDPLHIRLVMNPLELAQIPFEFALPPAINMAGEKVPMLTNPKRIVTLTREVRQESEIRYTWPHVPRILFAWAAPSNPVPYEQHLAALTEIIKPLTKPKKDIPYPEPDMDVFFTALPNASVQSLGKAIARGIEENRPYTHVNILAHGVKVEMAGREFRLVLCKDGSSNTAEKVDGKKLTQAFISDKGNGIPTVISLCVCDSGNTGNTIAPTGSLVYQLHNAGIPCVFASQFPLTQQGSVNMIKILYQQLVSACDPRVALYKTRMALREDANHDWASLVAYARFPQDIDLQLQAADLRMLFNSMKVTNAWVDHVFKFWGKIEIDKQEDALKGLETRLNHSIEKLSSFLNKTDFKLSILTTEILQAEHFGLLASAYKRKAEYLFRLIEFHPEKKAILSDQSATAIEKAKEFYNCGLEANPASHWTTIQYLSLKAVTEGSLKYESELWFVTKRMAQRDEKNAKNEADKIWAWGTLAELYLLKPLTVPDNNMDEEIIFATAIAKGYIKMMAETGKDHNDAKESTARQFERYIYWWPVLFPDKFPGLIGKMAIEIRGVLPPLQSLLDMEG